MRFTRSAAVLLVALALSACSPVPPSTDSVLGGKYGPDSPIRLGNLSLEDGRYILTTEIEIFVSGDGSPFELDCRLVDTSDRIGYLNGATTTVLGPRWVSFTSYGPYEIPDLTVGLRCFPDRPVVLAVVVRVAELTAVEVTSLGRQAESSEG